MNLLNTTNGRRVLFAALYASEGAPIGYIWWALPTKLSAAGVDVASITTITAVATLAWGLKFLWAPLIDVLRGPRWGYRAWIITAQLGMGAVLLPLLSYPMANHLSLATALLIVHAFLAATQDASVDALCIASIPQQERGSMNAWMQVGMLSSRAVFGGGALLLEAYIGERGVLVALIACIWCSTLLVLLAARPEEPKALTRSAEELGQRAVRFVSTLRAAFTSKRALLAIAFAIIGGAGFEAVGVIVGPLLLSVGATTKEVGVFLGLPIIVCMGVGSLVGGWRGDRKGRHRAVTESILMIVVVVVALSALHRFGPDQIAWSFGLLGLLYFFIGTFTASSYAMFMDLTDARLGATQFSAYMGATNLCESWSGSLVGRLADARGFGFAILVPAGISLLALPIVQRLNCSNDPSAEQPQAPNGKG